MVTMPQATNRSVHPQIGRASLFMWIAGGAMTLLFGLYAILLAVLPAVVDEAKRAGTLTTDMITALEQLEDQAGSMALTASLLGVLPAVALIWLGFMVRRGTPGWTKAGRILANVQAVVLVVLTLDIAVSALRMGNPAALTISLLIFGSLAGMLFYAGALLRRRPMGGAARTSAYLYDLDTDPWAKP